MIPWPLDGGVLAIKDVENKVDGIIAAASEVGWQCELENDRLRFRAAAGKWPFMNRDLHTVGPYLVAASCAVPRVLSLGDSMDTIHENIL